MPPAGHGGRRRGEALPLLDKSTIFAKRWDHADPDLKRNHQQLMCAEILVPDRVDPTFIEHVYVPSSAQRASAEAVCGEVAVEVKGSFFFRG